MSEGNLTDGAIDRRGRNRNDLFFSYAVRDRMELLPQNIIFNLHFLFSGTRRSANPTFILSKKINNEIIPNLITSEFELQVKYKPEVLMDPQDFIRKNKRLLESLSTVYTNEAGMNLN